MPSAHLAPTTAPLVDPFGRVHTYLRISLAERCNLRCRYCMPEGGVPLQPQDALLSNAEVVAAARYFVARGVDKVRLTGGAPLLRRDVAELCGELRALDGLRTLAVTTNGILLKRRLPALLDAGVNLFNVSLDTLVPAKFQFITRRKGFDRVVGAVEDLLAETDRSGRGKGALTEHPVKVNVVVMRGFNDDELADFVGWTRDHANLEVRFIEYMPFDDNAWHSGKFVSYFEMVSALQEAFPGFARVDGGGAPVGGGGDGAAAAADPSATAKLWRAPGHAGTVGFITSMSEHFCGGCNRLRVTADGQLKACLFGADEVNIRDALRAGGDGGLVEGGGDAVAVTDALHTLVEGALARKHFALGGNKDMHGIAANENRPMILIGG